ncbi:hypothetical protein [Ectobacillus panaciterrae]|uniref:hypothetical protein n=1 Tax=Ectobacillus panaciterrae TaxID=363872 RepID=UPI00040EF1F8|nr:hypothetical protein [Ectobacillus panaciterrae]
MNPKKMLVFFGCFILVIAFIAYWSLKSDDQKEMKTYKIIKKSDFNQSYIMQVQENPTIRGYTTNKTGPEGRGRIIVLTQGDQKPHGKIHIQTIDTTKKKTKITVKVDGKTEEKNPMIIFNIPFVPGEIEIMDTEGKEYKEIQ